MSKQPVLILGGRSDIGLAIAHRFASSGHPIYLAARNASSLDREKCDISLRHEVNVDLVEFDALDTASHEDWATSLSPAPGIVISAVGYMGEQSQSERSTEDAAMVMRSNFEGPASILSVFANRFEQQGKGALIGISSVAGERGRATNYVYGSAKAGFTAFLSGLRNRLSKKGVQVITVLPGFVETQMTEGLDLPKKLTAKPEEVATKVFQAVRQNKDVVYVKTIWSIIMMVIRSIPEFAFKRMSI
ncbi:SDR family oxidoreductase [Grimontia kaedaensis]|uniref:SDR family oxidoreductase n=1 Tax=Grimontia kaedaensis TaxID=2872157 RepID=A0ABY4WW56_9GAMM|nr:SDR family oxidoreductase [Grimontia kaedaensis]USH03505.1 SDR family oxidoreductase [Grimontia kaedaensis]